MKNLFKRIYLRALHRNQFYSVKLRNYYAKKFGIYVGLYSYGCFDPGRIRSGTTIGRYCSFAPTACVMTRNHPTNCLTTHPVIYEKSLGLGVNCDLPFDTCLIEDDVWVGQNAIVLPNVKLVGRGSVIGAGAVVTKDVPPYAIVVGNPARVLRLRFNDNVIQRIEESRWWTKTINELAVFAKEHPKMILEPASVTNSDWDAL